MYGIACDYLECPFKAQRRTDYPELHRLSRVLTHCTVTISSTHLVCLPHALAQTNPSAHTQHHGYPKHPLCAPHPVALLRRRQAGGIVCEILAQLAEQGAYIFPAPACLCTRRKQRHWG